MSDLFNNPLVEAAKKSMSPEELEEYKKIGEYMFRDMNFEKKEVKIQPNFDEAADYLSEAIKSGLHPSMMEDNEKCVMEQVHGDKWWEKFGYVEGDLTEIITIKN